MNVLGWTKLDVVLMCLSLSKCFELLDSFALCLRRLRLFYNLTCVVVDSFVVCRNCFHCFSLH